MKKDKILLPFIGITIIGIFLFSRVQAGSSYLDELRPFLKAYQSIQNQYVEKVEPNILIEGAIKGMIESLNDPHSQWMSPKSYQEMEIEKEGEFGGLGIKITMKDGLLIIVSPIEGTPASRAGLQPDDVILRIDGSSTTGITLNEAVSRLRGKPGTQVNITIQREGEKEPFQITLVRDVIQVPNLKKSLLPDEIGYIRIIGFTNENTANDLKTALINLKKEKIKGLILDLRNNPGGLLSQAIAVADQFLSSGIIVSTQGREPESAHIYQAHSKGEGLKIPLIVLINEYSASASEIVAGALKDQKRAILTGTKTFGKGSVQSIIPLDNDGAMAITTAKYYTPSGVSIEGKGIEPDLKVDKFKLTVEEKKVVGKITESPSFTQFLQQFPHWEEQNLEPLLKQLEEKKLVVDQELLKMILRQEDKNEENDYLNDSQLLQALSLFKSWQIFSTWTQHN